jgi:hypothetical protein
MYAYFARLNTPNAPIPLFSCGQFFVTNKLFNSQQSTFCSRGKILSPNYRVTKRRHRREKSTKSQVHVRRLLFSGLEGLSDFYALIEPSKPSADESPVFLPCAQLQIESLSHKPVHVPQLKIEALLLASTPSRRLSALRTSTIHNVGVNDLVISHDRIVGHG